MEVSEQLCSEVVQEFDQQGWHRTGSVTDTDSAAWLQQRCASIGLEAEQHLYPFHRVDPGPCTVDFSGTRIEGYPLLDSLLPPPGTIIKGAAAPPGDAGTVGVMRMNQHRNEAELNAARTAGHQAIVAAIEGDEPGFTLLNAWRFGDPYGPPVIQVPISAWNALNEARESAAQLTIVCGAGKTSTNVANVIGRLPGRYPERAPLVVLTPRSGWWYCAGERGGGLAIWLELARVLRETPLSRDVVFLATTGHELGYLGVRMFLDRDPSLAVEAKAWLHLGANVGAAGTRLMVRASGQSLLDAAQAPGSSTQERLKPNFEVTNRPLGEAGVVAEFGGRFVSFIGASFPLFHSINDRWPASGDWRVMAEAGELALRILRTLDAD
jgi:hypothetical protein